MAEALGVAGSLTSFIGLAGQVAQGVNYLYNFFSSMKDAPKDIKLLVAELKVLGTILDEVNRDGIDSAPTRAALQWCKEITGDLESLIRKNNLTTDQSKARRVWSQMGVAFRNEKFRKYTDRLERAKSTLLHAKIEAHGSMHQQQLSGIQNIQDSLSKMSVENLEAIKRATEAAKLAQAELQTLPSRATGLVAGEVSTIIAKNHATCSTILTEVRASSIRADQNVEEIKMVIQSLLSNESTSKIATLLAPALEKAISDRIDSSKQAFRSQVGSLQPESRREYRPLNPDDANSPRITPRYYEHQFGAASLNHLSYTATCISAAGESKKFNFWFGRLILSTSVLASWEGPANRSNLQRAEFLETKVTFIPSRWLLRKGAVLKITRLVSAIVAPSIQFSLTPVMVLSEDHKIIGAMQYGDLAKVQRLIRNGNVHPSSIFPDGSSLIHKCMNGLLERFQKDVKAAKRFPRVFQEAVDLSDITRVACWLVSWGSDVDTIDAHGRTCFLILCYIFHRDLGLIGYACDSANELEELGVSMVRASKSSPFFGQPTESGELKPTKFFGQCQDLWWSFTNVVAKWSQPEVSASVCLATLQLLWNIFPYNRGNPDWVYSVHPELETTDLIQSAIAGKVWLAGEPQQSARCFHLLYQSIRGALVFASPYYDFHDGRLNGLKEAISYRAEIINAIAEMVQFDKDISTYSEGDETLTDCASKWRSLDIWKLALEKAGCDTFSIIDQNLWCAKAHFYDPLGFVSEEPGTSVRVTADLVSGKVIMAIDERQYYDAEDSEIDDDMLHPRHHEFEDLTSDWPCILKLPRVHCEVYPSRPIDPAEKDIVPENGGESSRSQYKLQPTDDGGIELFIDCCEVGEPWERLCAQVRRQQCQRDGRYSPDSWSEMSEDEDSDSASPGIFSKIAEVGVEILSAIV